MLRKAEQTRALIIKGAMAVFEQHGFYASTIKEIAKAAGIAEGTIYKYFDSKDELLEAIAEQLIQGLEQQKMVALLARTIEQKMAFNFEKKIRVIALTCLKKLDQYVLHIKVLMPEVRYNLKIRDRLFTSLGQEVIEMMETLLNEAKQKGEIRDISNITFIRTLFGAIWMFFLQVQHLPEMNKEIKLQQEIDNILDIVMLGIIKNKESKN